jgi:hypothetical protein
MQQLDTTSVSDISKSVSRKLRNCGKILTQNVCLWKIKKSKYIQCFLNIILKVSVEDSIVSAPVVRVQSKNTNNAKVRLHLNS